MVTMGKLSVFIDAVLGGACIALGGTVFLCVDNKIIGALLFTLGLFTIVTNKYNLYTGKVPYIFERPVSYLGDVAIIWFGNLCGTVAVGLLELQTRFMPSMYEKARDIVDAKLNDGILSVFILAALCNILMYIAVDGFGRNEHQVGKYIGLFLGVSGFILAGFEHCVANMYYFTIAKVWDGHAAVYMLVMTVGNAAGGVLLPLARLVKG